MKNLTEITKVIDELNDEMFAEMGELLNNYFEKGGTLKLYNFGKKIGLTVDEIWKWENC